jgi:hypothetical protein
MVKTANRIHRRLMMEELEPRISPAWLEMGLNSATLAGIGSASNPGLYGGPALAELPDGNPIAVWTSSGTNTEIYAKHWDGSAWQEYTWAGGSSATGGGISNTPSTSQSPAVAVGTDGNPIVAWADYSGTNFEIYVRRWNGASWAEFSPGSASGTGISGTTTSGAWPAITIGSDGNPIVSWHEYVSSKYQLYVKGWNGSSWVPMGAGSASGNGISGSTKGIAQSTPSSLVVGTNGVPIVA